MRALVVRIIVNAIGLWAAVVIVPNVQLTGSSTTDKALTLLVVAAIFGLVNAIIKPIVVALSLPAFILTLGLFTFLVNGFLFWLSSRLAQSLGRPYEVEGFWAAVLGALVVTVVGMLLGAFAKD